MDAIINALRFDSIQGLHNADRETFVSCHSQHIGKVILSLGIIIAHFRQQTIELFCSHGEHTSVNSGNTPLVLAGIFLFNHRNKRARLVGDHTPIAGWIIALGCQHGGVSGRRAHQFLERLWGNERNITEQHQDQGGHRTTGKGTAHRVTRSQLLRLFMKCDVRCGKCLSNTIGAMPHHQVHAFGL